MPHRQHRCPDPGAALAQHVVDSAQPAPRGRARSGTAHDQNPVPMTVLDQRGNRGAARRPFIRDHRGQGCRPGGAVDEHDPLRLENLRQPDPA